MVSRRKEKTSIATDLPLFTVFCDVTQKSALVYAHEPDAHYADSPHCRISFAGTMQRQAYGFRDVQFFKLKILDLHRTKYALVG